MQTRRERVAVPTTIHCDHLIQARAAGEADLRASLDENAEVYAFLRSAAAKYGAGFWEPGAGIIHQVVLENYAFPGELILGTDSHTPNAGGLGACAVGVGGADAVEVIAGLPWELRYPSRIAVFLTGSARRLDGAQGRDPLGGRPAHGRPAAPTRSSSTSGRARARSARPARRRSPTWAPSSARRRRCSRPTRAWLRYLRATGRGELARARRRNRALLEPDAEVEARPEQHYDRVLELDLSKLEPHVVGPHSPDRARPISRSPRRCATRRARSATRSRSR